ncbi:MAG: hypothetical protein WDN50_25720 [Bradyrhizobium sp.]
MDQVTPSKSSVAATVETTASGSADSLAPTGEVAASNVVGADIAKARMLARRQALLTGPILPTMLKLAIPTLIVLVVQTMVGIAETYFVSFLGTDALAGVALVFPVLMLMQMMSNGGIGGGCRFGDRACARGRTQG